jgi:hypothetical protein
MTTPTAAGATGRPAPPDLPLLLLVAAAAVLEALALLLRPLLAHAIAMALTAAGWRPERPAAPAKKNTAQPAVSSPTAPQASAVALAALPVRELRQLARQAGHRALARSGRRAELLLALAA